MSNRVVDPAEEYAKTSKLKKEDVKSLMEWAEKQPHLPKISEFQFILFLQSCYFNNELAKQAIDIFFTSRSLSREIFGGRDPKDPNIQQAIDCALVTFLPKELPNGFRVLYAGLVDPNPDVYHHGPQLRMFDMSIVSGMHTKGTCEGIALVVDMKLSSLSHVLKQNLTNMKKYLYYLQEGLPIRLREIHLANPGTLADRVLTLFRPFIKKELQDMLMVHSTLDSLYKHIPKEYLPSELGGDVGTLKELQEKVRGDFLANEEFFKKDEVQTTDESKRTEKPKDLSKIFGLEGTFKKLDLD